MSFTKALFLVAAGGTAYATVQAGLWGDGYDSIAKLNSIKSFLKGEIDYSQNQSDKETTPPNVSILCHHSYSPFLRTYVDTFLLFFMTLTPPTITLNNPSSIL